MGGGWGAGCCGRTGGSSGRSGATVTLVSQKRASRSRSVVARTGAMLIGSVGADCPLACQASARDRPACDDSVRLRRRVAVGSGCSGASGSSSLARRRAHVAACMPVMRRSSVPLLAHLCGWSMGGRWVGECGWLLVGCAIVGWRSETKPNRKGAKKEEKEKRTNGYKGNDSESPKIKKMKRQLHPTPTAENLFTYRFT